MEWVDILDEVENRGHDEACEMLKIKFVKRSINDCTCDRVDIYQAEFEQYAKFRKEK